MRLREVLVVGSVALDEIRDRGSRPLPAEDLDFILWDLVQNAYIQESATLAEEIQERLAADMGMENRGVKQAGFRVLVGAFMPAVLVELGFLSNPDDEKELTSDAWRDRMTDSVTAAIDGYFTKRIARMPF